MIYRESIYTNSVLISRLSHWGPQKVLGRKKWLDFSGYNCWRTVLELTSPDGYGDFLNYTVVVFYTFIVSINVSGR